MDKAKIDSVVRPDINDPDIPADEQPRPNPATGKKQPQKQPQTEPLEPGSDTDIGGDV